MCRSRQNCETAATPEGDDVPAGGDTTTAATLGDAGRPLPALPLGSRSPPRPPPRRTQPPPDLPPRRSAAGQAALDAGATPADGMGGRGEGAGGAPALPPVASRVVPLFKLAEVLEGGEDALEREFGRLEQGYAYSQEAGAMEVNRAKNRHKGIIPYDHNRITLSVPSPARPSDPMDPPPSTTAPAGASAASGDDYINASLINVRGQRYIAAMGPTAGTHEAFWRMIWEQNVECIVMLTQVQEKGREKCFPYLSADFPLPASEGGGRFVVVTLDVDPYPHYHVTTLLVARGSREAARRVHHYHLTAWPSFALPETPVLDGLLDMLQRLRTRRLSLAGAPPLVHCSGGVGRTGTLLALDINLGMLAREGVVDVFGVVNHLRRQRPMMVHSAAQYRFIYEALNRANAVDAFLHSYRIPLPHGHGIGGDGEGDGGDGGGEVGGGDGGAPANNFEGLTDLVRGDLGLGMQGWAPLGAGASAERPRRRDDVVVLDMGELAGESTTDARAPPATASGDDSATATTATGGDVAEADAVTPEVALSVVLSRTHVTAEGQVIAEAIVSAGSVYSLQPPRLAVG